MMSTEKILAEIPKLSAAERRCLLDRIMELEDEAAVLDAMRHNTDEAFQILDAMEDEDATRKSE
jgi:hypothetical protein